MSTETVVLGSLLTAAGINSWLCWLLEVLTTKEAVVLEKSMDLA